MPSILALGTRIILDDHERFKSRPAASGCNTAVCVCCVRVSVFRVPCCTRDMQLRTN